MNNIPEKVDKSSKIGYNTTDHVKRPRGIVPKGITVRKVRAS